MFSLHELFGVVLLCLIGFFSFLIIFSKKTLFINQFSFFTIIFLVILPISERVYEVNYQAYISNELFLRGCFYISIFYLATISLYFFCNLLRSQGKRSINYKYQLINHNYELSTNQIYKSCFFYFILAILMITDKGEGISLYRESSNSEVAYYYLSREIHEYFLKPLVFNVGLFLLIYLNSRFAKFVILVTIVILIFPTSIARFASAALYGSIIYLFLFKLRYFDKSFGTLVAFINCIGILFVFPVLDFFRRPTELSDLKFSFVFLLTGHFDAFQNFCLSLEFNPTFGSNLLGAIYFWIPRSIWVDKPTASNIYLAEYYKFSYDNVSFPLPAEFFSALGFPGLILGGFIIGALLFYLDSIWHNFYRFRNFFVIVILLQLSQLFIYVMRGALLSSFAYLMGILFSWIFIYYFLYKKK
jgi:hypothetical protein